MKRFYRQKPVPKDAKPVDLQDIFEEQQQTQKTQAPKRLKPSGELAEKGKQGFLPIKQKTQPFPPYLESFANQVSAALLSRDMTVINNLKYGVTNPESHPYYFEKALQPLIAKLFAPVEVAPIEKVQPFSSKTQAMHIHTYYAEGTKGTDYFSMRDSFMGIKRAKRTSAYTPFKPVGGKFVDRLNAALRLHQPKVKKNKILVPNLRDEVLEVIDSEGNKANVNIKLPDMDHKHVPKFVPQYQVLAPDLNFIALIKTYGTTVDNPDFAAMCYATEESLLQVASTTYFGNGSPNGQMGRFKACLEVSESLKPPRNKEYEKTSADTKKIWKKHFPINHERVDWSIPTPGGIQESKRGVALITVNKSADAGPLFPNMKREQTFMSELTMANQLIEDVCASMVEMSENDAKNYLHKYFDWGRLAYLKPKGEIYTREEYETKTRNYFPTTAALQMPAQVVYASAFYNTALPWEQEGSFSLLGFSAFNGGMDSFVRHIRAQKQRKMVYADNAYITFKYEGKWYYASIDGSKMEACIRPEDVYWFNSYLCDQVGIKDKTSWSMYMKHMHPYFSSDQVVVLGEQQFVNNGMGSGCIGTAQINTAKMVRALATWDDCGLIKSESGDWLLNKSGESAFSKVGIKVTIEHVLCIDDTDWESKDRIKLDCLGFDAKYMGEFGIDGYIPVLDADRMAKMLVFMKSQNSSATEQIKNSIAKFTSAFLMGSWLDPVLSQVIKLHTNIMRKTLSIRLSVGGDVDTEELMKEITELSKSALGDISSLFSEDLWKEMPSLYSMIKLFFNEETANLWYLKLAPEMQDQVKQGIKVKQVNIDGDSYNMVDYPSETKTGEGVISVQPKFNKQIDDAEIADEPVASNIAIEKTYLKDLLPNNVRVISGKTRTLVPTSLLKKGGMDSSHQQFEFLKAQWLKKLTQEIGHVLLDFDGITFVANSLYGLDESSTLDNIKANLRPDGDLEFEGDEMGEIEMSED